MTYTNTELTELVCTRISHDLIGSIGAVLGGLELVDENNGQLDDDIKNILFSGAQTLKSRQKFFRVAFGTDTQKVSADEIKELCESYLATIGCRATPLKLRLESISSELAKIACLCLMIVAEVSIKGGEICISADNNHMKATLESSYKLAEGKISAYKDILDGKKVSENISQYAQLIYLREFLGNNIGLGITTKENYFELIIG